MHNIHILNLFYEKFRDIKRAIRRMTHTAMTKGKRTNNDLQNTTQKTKDRVTLTPLKTGGELRWSGR